MDVKKDFKSKKYIIMDSENYSIAGKTELNQFDIRILKYIKDIKAIAFVATLFVLFLIIQQSMSHRIEINKLNTHYNTHVSNSLNDLDSNLNTCLEIIQQNHFNALIAEATIFKHHEKPTRDNVWKFIEECNPWYPDIIMAQAIQESSCGQSNVAKRCHNLFGMNKPKKRDLCCDINRYNVSEPYAEYLNWKASVIDRILWDLWVFKDYEQIPSKEEYLRVIGSVYNTESEDYVSKIVSIAKNYQ